MRGQRDAFYLWGHMNMRWWSGANDSTTKAMDLACTGTAAMWGLANTVRHERAMRELADEAYNYKDSVLAGTKCSSALWSARPTSQATTRP